METYSGDFTDDFEGAGWVAVCTPFCQVLDPRLEEAGFEVLEEVGDPELRDGEVGNVCR